jgi:aryl-alcohol dehydrogenase-like predicted oxidoreductase
MGWGQIDDDESVRAIHRALDLGVTLFDTANNYGAGHSERILGSALQGRRHEVVVATKFGSIFDEDTKTHFDNRSFPPTAEAVREACEASLRRLGTDYIDVYQFHAGGYDPDGAAVIRDILEDQVASGKIRWYGWSTDDPARARIFAQGKHCTAIQHALNLFADAPEMLAVCDEFDLASINKSPLRSGFLTGKYAVDSTFPEDDERHGADLHAPGPTERLSKVQVLGQMFAEGDTRRSPAQTALGWILARSPRTVPIPGFKTVVQVEDNTGVLRLPPLSVDELRKISELIESPQPAT